MSGIALTQAWYPLRPHPEQYALWICPARFIAVPAGRRSGKTELAKRRLVRALAEARPWPDPRYFFGAPTEKQAKRIAWEHLLALIPNNWIDGGKYGRNVNNSELWVRTIFGSRVYIIGFDAPARFEGPPWDGGIMDESSDYRPGVFDRTVRPALADRGGWCWRIGVPKRQGTSAREYKKFCDECASGEYPDGAMFTWESADILPAEEVKQAQETLDPKDFNEQFRARWETAGGAIFYAFSAEYNVRPCTYHPERPLVIGADFNVDPMAWVVGHRYPNQMEWLDELWIRDTNTQAALSALYERYQHHKGGFEFYGDASCRSRDTSAAVTDYVQILNDERFQRLGRTVHIPASNPAVVDRFAACNAMFSNAAGIRRMFVDPRCRRLIEDLESRYYRPGTREAADSGDLGHITDAMGYPVHKLFPIRLEEASKPGQVIIRQGR